MFFIGAQANWGGTFPTSWVWVQGIGAGGTAQLLLTAGEFEIAGITSKQAIIAWAAHSPLLSAAHTHEKARALPVVRCLWFTLPRPRAASQLIVRGRRSEST